MCVGAREVQRPYLVSISISSESSLSSLLSYFSVLGRRSDEKFPRPPLRRIGTVSPPRADVCAMQFRTCHTERRRVTALPAYFSYMYCLGASARLDRLEERELKSVRVVGRRQLQAAAMTERPSGARILRLVARTAAVAARRRRVVAAAAAAATAVIVAPAAAATAVIVASAAAATAIIVAAAAAAAATAVELEHGLEHGGGQGSKAEALVVPSAL